jgi:copper resistance protein C
MMRCLRVVSLVLLWAAITVSAEAHAFLDHASPAVGCKVKQQPNVVRIWFTEPIVAASSTIKVFDVIGNQIDKKDTHIDANNQALLHVSLPLLAPGIYKIVWSVMSVDGHHTTGDFTFRVIP